MPPNNALTDEEIRAIQNQHMTSGFELNVLGVIEFARAIEKLVTQKAREAALEEWKPIETAPRDGGYFLTANFHNCFDPLGEYEVARYDPREFDDYEDAGGGLFRKVTKTLMEFTSDNFHRATHWAPIPRAIKDQHLPTEVKNG